MRCCDAGQRCLHRRKRGRRCTDPSVRDHGWLPSSGVGLSCHREPGPSEGSHDEAQLRVLVSDRQGWRPLSVLSVAASTVVAQAEANKLRACDQPFKVSGADPVSLTPVVIRRGPQIGGGVRSGWVTGCRVGCSGGGGVQLGFRPRLAGLDLPAEAPLGGDCLTSDPTPIWSDEPSHEIGHISGVAPPACWKS